MILTYAFLLPVVFMILLENCHFSPNAEQGFPFHFGGPGFELCSADVAKVPATGRNRSREVAMAVPMASPAKRIIFVVFQRCIASFRVAGVALCDIQHVS